MFIKYSDKISNLSNFEKSDILTDNFLLHRESNLEMYYAPHNEYINKDARVFIIGICPGWTQTQIAYKTANNGLKNNLPFEEYKNSVNTTPVLQAVCEKILLKCWTSLDCIDI